MNAMNSVNSRADVGRGALGLRADGSPIQQEPVRYDIDSAQYTELDLHLDEKSRILWCDMQPSGRPTATFEMMSDIGAMQASLRQSFARREAGAPTPFDYFVFGSKTPGIYNLGGDLGFFVRCIRERDIDGMRRYGYMAVERQYESSLAFGAPIISLTLVRGDALGGGFEFALSFDVIVAERSANMGLPEVLFNLFPGMGAYSFLSRRLDRRKAEELILSGRIYTAAELYDLGLVDVLAEDGEGEHAVREYVAQHARKFNMRRAVYEARRRVNPISMQELLDIVDIWVETAMKLEERDLRIMERLCAAQDRRLAGNRSMIRAVGE